MGLAYHWHSTYDKAEPMIERYFGRCSEDQYCYAMVHDKDKDQYFGILHRHDLTKLYFDRYIQKHGRDTNYHIYLKRMPRVEDPRVIDAINTYPEGREII